LTGGNDGNIIQVQWPDCNFRFTSLKSFIAGNTRAVVLLYIATFYGSNPCNTNTHNHAPVPSIYYTIVLEAEDQKLWQNLKAGNDQPSCVTHTIGLRHHSGSERAAQNISSLLKKEGEAHVAESHHVTLPPTAGPSRRREAAASRRTQAEVAALGQGGIWPPTAPSAAAAAGLAGPISPQQSSR
jgi:hypothetical protein